MKITSRSKYGLRAIAYLAQSACCCSVRDVAQNQSIPLEFLEKIFSDLKKANLIVVKRGVRGGYFLSRPPENINVKQVVEVLDGDLSPVECLGVNSSPCAVSNRCFTKKSLAKSQKQYRHHS